MSHLVFELLLIFLLTAVIGWFLGRYLCKSGEYDERARNRQLDKELETTRTELQHRDQSLEDARNQLNQASQQTAALEQQKEGLTAQLSSLNQERDKLLLKLQELEVCNTRLQSLTEEFNQQRQQILEFRDTKNTLQGQIDKLQTTLQHTSEQLVSSQQLNHKQQTELEQVKTENERQARTIALLEEDRQELQQSRQQMKADRTRIEILEEDKKNLHDHFNTLQSEYQQLSQQCKSMRDEIREKDKLSLEVERLSLEKQDFLGRLRAISNVVDVISKHQDNAPEPILIEQWQPHES